MKSQGGNPFAIHVRIPAWAKSAQVLVNGIPAAEEAVPGTFLTLEEAWSDQIIHLEFEKAITIEPLPGAENLVAFLDGPVVLAGLCSEERTLYVEADQMPEELLTADNEREWGNWMNTYKTVGQEHGLRFVPLYQVGYDAYTVYFPIDWK